MRKFMTMLVVAGATLLVVPAAQAQKVPNRARDMMKELNAGGLDGKALDAAIKRAEAHPLGSEKNPVRENMPEGEYAYLGRLRCADGASPKVEREGNVGEGVYRNIVDLFDVTCPGQAAVKIYMDMYHDGPETRPVPGFTLAD
ncbi:MAG: hypothetical protein V4574_20930 [Pseudomonadota bacterium]